MKAQIGKKIVYFIALAAALFTAVFLSACDKTPSHVHAYGAWQTLTEATCAEAGSQKRACDCGEEETREVQALGHTYGEWQTLTEPNCTEAGSQKRVCHCGAEEMRPLQALGHTYGAWQTALEPNCTEAGSQKRTCHCGEEETREVQALGHTYGAWQTALEPNCTEAGSQKRVCHCGAEETRPLQALGHSYGAWQTALEPNCTEAGSQKRVCHCGAEETRPLQPLGHAYGAWTILTPPTCTAEGARKRTCVCGDEQSQTLAKTEHIYGFRHDETGHWQQCDSCGEQQGRAAHVFDGLTVTPPTCTQQGSKKLSCVCGLFTTESIEKTPHTPGGWQWLEQGEECFNVKKCTACSLVCERLKVSSGLGYADGGVAKAECTESEIVIPYVGPSGEVITEIISTTFANSANLISVLMPDTLTVIGNHAFSGCSALASVGLPAGLKTIGVSAFMSCKSLKDIALPDGITSIGNSAFVGCESLAFIELPSSLTSVGTGAFANCHSLRKVVIASGVSGLSNNVFLMYGAVIYVEDAAQPSSWANNWSARNPVIYDYKNNTLDANGYEYIQSEGIYYRIKEDAAEVFTAEGSVTSVVLPEAVTYKEQTYRLTAVGDLAFFNLSRITDVTLSDSITSIGEYAFYYCTALQSIDLPSGLTSIGEYAFYNCSALQSIDLPSGLTSIGGSAFYNCYGLSRITLPLSVTEVGPYLFSWLANLIVYVEAESAPVGFADNWNNGKHVIYDCNNNALDALGYEYFTVGGITYMLKEGEAAVFAADQAVASVAVPEFITYKEKNYVVMAVAYFAFSNCVNLTDIALPEGIIGIGEYAFYNCKSLSSITLPSSITGMGQNVFYDCTALAEINCAAPAQPQGWGEGWMGNCSADVTWGYTA